MRVISNHLIGSSSDFLIRYVDSGKDISWKNSITL